jgi:hypothetical protein
MSELAAWDNRDAAAAAAAPAPNAPAAAYVPLTTPCAPAGATSEVQRVQPKQYDA